MTLKYLDKTRTYNGKEVTVTDSRFFIHSINRHSDWVTTPGIMKYTDRATEIVEFLSSDVKPGPFYGSSITTDILQQKCGQAQSIGIPQMLRKMSKMLLVLECAELVLNEHDLRKTPRRLRPDNYCEYFLFSFIFEMEWDC